MSANKFRRLYACLRKSYFVPTDERDTVLGQRMATEIYDAAKFEKLEKWFTAGARRCKAVRKLMAHLDQEQMPINHRERVKDARINFGLFFDDARTRLRAVAPPDLNVDKALDVSEDSA